MSDKYNCLADVVLPFRICLTFQRLQWLYVNERHCALRRVRFEVTVRKLQVLVVFGVHWQRRGTACRQVWPEQLQAGPGTVIIIVTRWPTAGLGPLSEK